LRERREAKLRLRIVLVVLSEHADPPHALGLLRPRREWPRRRRAKPRDELSPSHLSSPRLIVSRGRLQENGVRRCLLMSVRGHSEGGWIASGTRGPRLAFPQSTSRGPCARRLRSRK
jgi:hypothetical protein